MDSLAGDNLRQTDSITEFFERVRVDQLDLGAGYVLTILVPLLEEEQMFTSDENSFRDDRLKSFVVGAQKFSIPACCYDKQLVRGLAHAPERLGPGQNQVDDS